VVGTGGWLLNMLVNQLEPAFSGDICGDGVAEPLPIRFAVDFRGSFFQ